MVLANECVLEVEKLNIARSGSLVVNDASFKIMRRDYVGIVGPNGGGKTTLFLAILGIIPAQSGSIRIFGQDASSFSSWERVRGCRLQIRGRPYSVPSRCRAWMN